MLESIRSRSSGIFAWFIAGLIIVTMALFGVNSYVSDHVDQTLFESGEQKISLSDYQGALQQAQRRALSQGNEVDSSSIEFRRSVLSQLINRAIVTDTVAEAGYIASDETVAESVLKNSAFHLDGEFDQETYERFVSSNFGSEQRYWDLLRTSIASSQAASGMIESSLTVNESAESITSLISEKRSIDLVKFNVADLAKDIKVTDEQASEYYSKNTANYQAPEKVSVEYLSLSASSFESGISLSDEDVLAIYEQEKESYAAPEYRDVRHILFSGDEAQSQAEAALEQLKSGSKFEDLAKELSQDPGSAENGGSLGEIARGQMVEPFENAAFDLALNTVSEPVSTEFGVHLLEVTSIKGGELQSFDEVKDSIKKSEITRQAEDLYFDKLETLRNSVFENADTLQVAAEDLGLVVEKSEFFTRDEGKGFFVNPSVRSAAFGEAVLNENQNSDVIDITPTEVLVLRKSEHVLQQAKPFDDVKEQVTSAVKNELAKDKAQTLLNSSFDEVVSNGEWDASLKAQGLTSSEEEISYLEQESALPFNVASDLYSLADGSFTSRIGKSIDDFGNAYLYKLNTIAPSEVDEQIKELIEGDISFRNSVSVAQTFIADKIAKAMSGVDEDLL